MEELITFFCETVLDVIAAIKEVIIYILKPFADFFYKLVIIFPLWSVKLIFILILVGLGIWVVTLRGEKTAAEKQGGASVLNDLRYWALGVLILQTIIYIVFG